ncbi:MAG: flagellar biosynthetic protein FliR [Aquabacterium sp.]|uniref:flagellar biosynthetic protein FliR n=1 Tax=Aquabacterium sp. TaxID=1872578 RepID=UPI0025C1842E|nr:flagellar biosynthetic protein FliR [Aquabacterium sp.]MBI3381739.1 flagellar biosynthetic protein FliR [Aquabacterium sp.]
MEGLFPTMLATLTALWWPFCRVMAMLSAAPVIGEASVPVTVKVLLSLVLAVILMPTVHPVTAIDPMSAHGIVVAVEQAIIGGVLGLAFHLSMSAILVLGFLVSSQIGLSMAVMNDPLNGSSSDVISSLLSILSILAFFSMDGHLVLTGVVGASFQAWPVGGGLNYLALQTLVYNVAWVFSAALLLAIPVAFATLVVQVGFGFLTRVAPSLNLFSLGFSVITLFGVFMLSQVVTFVPAHYLRMTNRILEMLQGMMVGGTHG